MRVDQELAGNPRVGADTDRIARRLLIHDAAAGKNARTRAHGAMAPLTCIAPALGKSAPGAQRISQHSRHASGAFLTHQPLADGDAVGPARLQRMHARIDGSTARLPPGDAVVVIALESLD